MNIHIFIHVPFEGPGFIQQWADNAGHHVTFTRFYENKSVLPSLDGIDGLIVMGGPMGVYDENQYPWLRTEKAFIGGSIGTGKKVLGICLGAQLIAACLGAPVYTAPNKEIGWFPVQPTEEGVSEDWFNALFEHRPTVFHWHGDQFGMPSGAANLLRSEANGNQAFLYGSSVLGLQFHLECTPDTTRAMLMHGDGELDSTGPFVQSAGQITDGLHHCKSNNQVMEKLLSAFFLY